MPARRQTARTRGASTSAGNRPLGIDAAFIVALVLVALAVYANSIGGGWVYDDESQIVANHTIQDPAFYGAALLSDVWQFLRDPDRAASNYWRPTFVAWLILNHRLFGVEDPTGWHVTNVLLHAAVVALGYVLLRQLRFAPAAAAAAGLVYAVHPVHVESVAWVSGSPNMLVALPLVGALALVLAGLRRPGRLGFGLALLLFAVGQMAKEIAVFFPLVVGFAVHGAQPASTPRAVRLRTAARAALPFLAVSVVYLVARQLVLGQLQKAYAFQPGWLSVLLTLPSILAFYLRQALLPLWVEPLYPLRPLQPVDLGAATFWLPLLVALAVGALLVWKFRADPRTRIGVLLAALPLLPALNVNAFPPEEIVHDRYLYLPLLGIVLCSVAWLVDGLVRLRVDRTRAGWIALVLAVLCSVPLAVRTVRYNRDWSSNLALWSAAVQADPSSASGWYQYGAELFRRERLDEARAALDRALSVYPLTNAYITRADVAIRQRRYDAAERDLQTVLGSYDDFFKAYERMAVLYQSQNRWSDAERTLRTARERVRFRWCELTARLAVVLYRTNRKDEALRELESVLDRVPGEGRPGAKEVYLRLGLLHAERGRTAEARQHLEAYLRATRRFTDDVTVRHREIARRTLAGLGGR